MNERIPEGWIKTQLCECLAVPHKERESKPETIERLTVRLHGQGITRSGKFPKPTPNGRPYFKRFIGELLIGRQNLHNGGLGLVTKETSGLIASNAISSFINRASSDLSFIHQLLSTERFRKQIDSISSGTGQKEMSEGQILSCRVVVPPLLEQRRIASILTSVDKVIEHTQKKIYKLRDLKKAVMNELLTKGIGHTEFKESELGRIPEDWFTKIIGEIGPFFNGLKNKTSRDFGQGEPYITYLQVFNQRLSAIENAGFVSIEEGEQQEKVRYGDILFTTSSETPNEVGMTAVFLEKGWSPYLNSFCFGVRPKEGFPLSSQFANHLFRGEKFREEVRPLAQGSTRFNLSKENLKKIRFILPPIPEQRKIASILTSVDEVIENTQKKTNKLRDLKESLMQDLLTGKVRVKVC